MLRIMVVCSLKPPLKPVKTLRPSSNPSVSRLFYPLCSERLSVSARIANFCTRLAWYLSMFCLAARKLPKNVQTQPNESIHIISQDEVEKSKCCGR